MAVPSDFAPATSTFERLSNSTLSAAQSEHNDGMNGSPATHTVASYAFWSACLFGFCGLHRLYNGKIATGLLWMCTFGLLGIGQLVDLAYIPRMSEARSRQLNNRNSDRLKSLANTHTPGLVHTQNQASPLMLQLLQLAKNNSGRLTVTDCVLQTGAAIAVVEEELKALVKSGYATVSNDLVSGIVVYEIPELS